MQRVGGLRAVLNTTSLLPQQTEQEVKGSGQKPDILKFLQNTTGVQGELSKYVEGMEYIDLTHRTCLLYLYIERKWKGASDETSIVCLIS